MRRFLSLLPLLLLGLVLEVGQPRHLRAAIPDYAIRPADFAAQLEWLVGHGYHFVREIRVCCRPVAPIAPGQLGQQVEPAALGIDLGHDEYNASVMPT